MGVPVVTLAGNTHAGRVGTSLLGQLGLPNLVGRDVSEYTDIAAALAGPGAAERRMQWRTALRGVMRASPLCAPELFVPKLEAAFAAMAATRRREIAASA